MVSTNQSGNSTEWGTKEERFIGSDMDITPLLRGANTKDERQKWAGAMNRADRDFPPEFYELLAE